MKHEKAEVQPDLASSKGRLGPDTGLPGTWIFGVSSLIAGCVCLAVVNNSAGPFFLVPMLFAGGLAFHQVPGIRDRYLQRAFVLSFSASVLVAGLAQLYALMMFGEPQTTSDAQTMYILSCQIGGAESLEDLSKVVNAPLAIVVWRELYSFTSAIGFDKGPWVGVVLNGFLVGLAASMTVATARLIFGRDDLRLRMVGTLFACNGIFLLYGALFMRDSFILLLQALLVLVFIRTLKSPRLNNLVWLCLCIVASHFAFEYLRYEQQFILPIFAILALVSWTRKAPGWSRGGMLAIVGAVLLIGIFPIVHKLATSGIEQVKLRREMYADFAEETNLAGLGYRFVVNQPLPIRIPIGCIYLHVFPIPLWQGFSTSLEEYHWLKSYMGFYLVTVAPLGLAGVLQGGRKALRGGENAPPVLFLLLFLLFGMVSVAGTSLETRHYGQFLPSFMILAAIPDLRDGIARRRVFRVGAIWYGAVIAIHLCWLILKLL